MESEAEASGRVSDHLLLRLFVDGSDAKGFDIETDHLMALCLTFWLTGAI
jgi:hypothetical protein